MRDRKCNYETISDVHADESGEPTPTESNENKDSPYNLENSCIYLLNQEN